VEIFPPKNVFKLLDFSLNPPDTKVLQRKITKIQKSGVLSITFEPEMLES